MLTTRQLFRTAYSAARRAVRDESTHYESPLGAAMRATYGVQTLWRYKVSCAASRAAQMHGTYRVRASVRVLHSSKLACKLMAARCK